MTKKVQNQEEIAVAEVVGKTEQFFEKHGKKLTIGLIVLLVLAAIGFGYKYLILDKREAAAKELIAAAQEHIRSVHPDYEKALNGDENGAGLLEVIEKYGKTDAGNIANHYAGICYLRLGDFENADNYLKAYKPIKGSIEAEIINAQNIGLQGDVAAEQDKYAEAAELYKKAVELSANEATAPEYLYKRALVLEADGDIQGSQECYKSITEKYPKSAVAQIAEKALY